MGQPEGWKCILPLLITFQPCQGPIDGSYVDALMKLSEKIHFCSTGEAKTIKPPPTTLPKLEAEEPPSPSLAAAANPKSPEMRRAFLGHPGMESKDGSQEEKGSQEGNGSDDKAVLQRERIGNQLMEVLRGVAQEENKDESSSGGGGGGGNNNSSSSGKPRGGGDEQKPEQPSRCWWGFRHEDAEA